MMSEDPFDIYADSSFDLKSNAVSIHFNLVMNCFHFHCGWCRKPRTLRAACTMMYHRRYPRNLMLI